MFAKDESSMCRTLQEMHREAYQRANCNQIEAVKVMAGYIRQDKRFEGYDPAALAERVRQCRSNGAVLDLTDPVLRGQEARPLDRARWR
jgi:hypothetical protein